MDPEIFNNFVFFIHILATNMLESHSRALKTRILPSFQKNLSQNNGSIVWNPGPGEGGQINAKTPSRLAFHPENPNRKLFFLISTRRLDECAEGLNSSIAQSPGK